MEDFLATFYEMRSAVYQLQKDLNASRRLLEKKRSMFFTQNWLWRELLVEELALSCGQGQALKKDILSF